MLQHSELTHTIHITPLRDCAGWEYNCQACAYQARYRIPSGAEQARFEVIERGDSQVLHSSASQTQANLDLASQAAAAAAQRRQELWLTPDLRQQIEHILADW